MRVAGGFDDFSLRTRAVNQGRVRSYRGRDPWVVLAARDRSGLGQTNNGTGEAWLGKRNHGGTPQHDGLSEGQPATLKNWFLSRLLSLGIGRAGGQTSWSQSPALAPG